MIFLHGALFLPEIASTLMASIYHQIIDRIIDSREGAGVEEKP